MGGAVVLIWIIIFVLRQNGVGTANGGTKSDQTATQYGNVLVIAVGIILVGIVLHSINPLYATIFIVALVISSLARGYAFIAAKLGFYKAAYYIGKFSNLRLGANPFAVDIYCSFVAVMKIKSSDQRREALRWLRSRFQKKNKVYSGEMVMFVIIDSIISHPNDREYLAKRLKLLECIGLASVPSCVSQLACKLELLPALSRFDWPEINEIAVQWNTPAINPLASYLSEFYGAYIRGSRIHSKSGCWFWSFFLWRRRKIVEFARSSIKVLKDEHDASQQASPIEALVKSHGQAFDDITREKYLDLMLSEGAQKKWQKRAAELGVIQFDEAWKKIDSSVRNCEPMIDRDSFDEGEQQYLFYEQQQKGLSYLRASIVQKLSNGLPGSGFEYFLDWLNLLQVLDSLKSKKHVQQMAFTRIHNEIWNLSVELWNQRKEHCLVHHIATVCAPLARDCGLKDMHNILSGITSRRFK